MTNLEAIRANISDAHGVVLTQNHFVKALVDESLIPFEDYTTLNSAKIDYASIRLYDQILGGAGLSEGHLGYNFQLSGVIAAKKALEEKLGIADKKNEVNSAKYW